MKISSSSVIMDSVAKHNESDKIQIKISNKPKFTSDIQHPFDFSSRFNSQLYKSSSNNPKQVYEKILSGLDNDIFLDYQNYKMSMSVDQFHPSSTLLEGVFGQKNVNISAFSQLNSSGKVSLTSSNNKAYISASLIHEEQEEIFISSSGSIETEDGQSLQFSLDLSLKRSITVEQSMALMRPVTFIDPLILNFSNNGTILSDSTFLFDLNSDGFDETISMPSSGCGFLAYDHNSDGVINNGKELFGPSTQNGFAELSDFDEDGNLWIDENDKVFKDLLIWNQQADGNHKLLSLEDAGVGAISITSTKSPFNLHNSTGEIVGRLKGTGIFLTEEGKVRSLQEIDMASVRENIDIYGQAELIDENIKTGTDAINKLRFMIEMQKMRWRLSRARFHLMSHVKAEEKIERLSLQRWLEQNISLNDQFPSQNVENRISKLSAVSIKEILFNML